MMTIIQTHTGNGDNTAGNKVSVNYQGAKFNGGFSNGDYVGDVVNVNVGSGVNQKESTINLEINDYDHYKTAEDSNKLVFKVVSSSGETIKIIIKKV